MERKVGWKFVTGSKVVWSPRFHVGNVWSIPAKYFSSAISLLLILFRNQFHY